MTLPGRLPTSLPMFYYGTVINEKEYFLHQIILKGALFLMDNLIEVVHGLINGDTFGSSRTQIEIAKKDEIVKVIGKKLDCYKSPRIEQKIQYEQNCKGGVVLPLGVLHFCFVHLKFMEIYKMFGVTPYLPSNCNSSIIYGPHAWLWKLGRGQAF